MTTHERASTGAPTLPGLTAAVAEFIVARRWEDVPAPALDKAKKAIADTLGVILAGSRGDVAPPLLRYVAQSGEQGTSPVYGTALRTSPEVAALVNGTFGHALDFDDVLPIMPGHPSAVIIPALLAEHGAGDLSGRAFLEAYILGVEVGAKVGFGVGLGHYHHGWHGTSTMGIFAAVAALARLKGLDLDTTRQAIGIAASMASGLQRNFGTMTKPLHTGWASRSALTAVRLASVGFTAAKDALEAPAGFFAVYGTNESRADRTIEHLGRPWALLDPGLSLKKYPCCYALHRPIDAMLALRQQLGLTPENTRSVVCRVPPGSLLPLIYPAPRTGLEGKFSMEYTLAAGVLDGQFNLAAYSDEGVNRPAIKALLPRMKKAEDPHCISEDPPGERRSVGSRGFIEVDATTTGGRSATVRVDKPTGSPQHEMSWADIEEKFLDCVQSAQLPAAQGKAAFAILKELERRPDLAGLLALLRQGG